MKKSLKVSAANFSGKKLKIEVFEDLKFDISLKSDFVSFDHNGIIGSIDIRKGVEEKSEFHFKGINSLREITGMSQSDINIFIDICHKEFVYLIKSADKDFIKRHRIYLEGTSMYREAFDK